MKIIINKGSLAVLFAIVSLSSCSKDYRATRKINKLQSWGYLKTDTITIRDTIKGFDTLIVKQFDTLNHSDTLFVVKDGVRIQTIVKWKERIIEQQITKRDTIIETKFVRTEVLQPTKTKWWNKFWVGALTTFLFLVFLTIALHRLIYITND
jgi:hypothetical protein